MAYKFKLAGDDDLAARYQYMEAMADAWGRVMYGSMTKWCHEHGVGRSATSWSTGACTYARITVPAI